MSVFTGRERSNQALAAKTTTGLTEQPGGNGAQAPLPAPARSVTPRILLLSTVLIFINCYWIIETEGIWHSNHETAMSLMWNTVFFLLLLVLVNILILKRFFPRKAFSQGELITCYVMMTIASAL